MSITPTPVWPVLTCRDVRAEMGFLHDAFCLEETTVITREGDPSIIEHGEMRWPSGPGIIFGAVGKDEAEEVRGLRDEDYGSRGFTVRDPEGVLWSFGKYAGE